MKNKTAGHNLRHYQHKHLTSPNEVLLWHALFKLSQKVARESRYLVYRTLTKHLGHKNLIPDLYTLGCTAVALAENHGIPLTPAETIHQIVRSFLHLHDPPLQAIIWAYLRRYYSLITDREAFAVLVFASAGGDISPIFTILLGYWLSLLEEEIAANPFFFKNQKPRIARHIQQR